MFVALIILAVAVGVESTPSWVVMGGLCLYMAAFALSLGPICWVLYSELFPSHSREIGTASWIQASNSAGMALVTAIHFGWNMLVSLFFLSLYNLSPPGTFALYAAIAVLGIAFVYFFIPETKGISLEDIATSAKEDNDSQLLSDSESEASINSN